MAGVFLLTWPEQGACELRLDTHSGQVWAPGGLRPPPGAHMPGADHLDQGFPVPVHVLLGTRLHSR